MNRVAIRKIGTALFVSEDGHYGPIDTAFFWTPEMWDDEDMDRSLRSNEEKVFVSFVLTPAVPAFQAAA